MPLDPLGHPPNWDCKWDGGGAFSPISNTPLPHRGVPAPPSSHSRSRFTPPGRGSTPHKIPFLGYTEGRGPEPEEHPMGPNPHFSSEVRWGGQITPLTSPQGHHQPISPNFTELQPRSLRSWAVQTRIAACTIRWQYPYFAESRSIERSSIGSTSTTILLTIQQW
jgi:hypothetical protein